jgi:hypothetical protein
MPEGLTMPRRHFSRALPSWLGRFLERAGSARPAAGLAPASQGGDEAAKGRRVAEAARPKQLLVAPIEQRQIVRQLRVDFDKGARG